MTDLAVAPNGHGLLADYPLGRFARPQDPVYAALYLASDEASFLTGQVLVVDGGKTVH